MIAIPNMEKPKDSCWECPLQDCEGNCLLLDKGIPFEQEGRHPDCPLIEIVRCGECKHKPIKHDPEGGEYGFNLVSPNGYDNLCPCLNTDDGFYSYMPDDNFFCAYGERRDDDNTIKANK